AEKLSEEHGFGITISDAPISIGERHFSFKGRIRGKRGEKYIAIPVQTMGYGFIAARSVLYGSRPQDVKWLLNGQAYSSRTSELMCFVGRESPLSLHISKDRLKAWTHQALD